MTSLSMTILCIMSFAMPSLYIMSFSMTLLSIMSLLIMSSVLFACYGSTQKRRVWGGNCSIQGPTALASILTPLSRSFRIVLCMSRGIGVLRCCLFRQFTCRRCGHDDDWALAIWCGLLVTLVLDIASWRLLRLIRCGCAGSYCDAQAIYLIVSTPQHYATQQFFFLPALVLGDDI